MRSRTAFCVLIALVAGFAAPARSASFDLIYTDHVNVTLCQTCGIVLGGEDFALVVNRGASDIEGPELFSTSFTCTSSRPELVLTPFLNNPVNPPIVPIMPHEATGSVGAGSRSIMTNAVLTTLLLPGETFHNTSPEQTLAFSIFRTGLSLYEGRVTFDVTMEMGGEIATFTIDMDVKLGDFQMSFPSAARVSSVPLSTPVAHRSWGAIKSLYR